MCIGEVATASPLLSLVSRSHNFSGARLKTLRAHLPTKKALLLLARPVVKEKRVQVLAQI